MHVPPPPPRPRRGRHPIWKFLGILVVVGGFFFLGLVALVWMLGGEPVSVESGGWIDLTLRGTFPEERSGRTGLDSVLASELSAQDVLIALRHAAGDARIAGVVLRPDGFGGGWAQAAEIRRGLARLRDVGKRVVAYVEAPGPAAYYLAAAADQILIPPEGSLYIVGLSGRMTYLKGTLDKAGMAADYVAIGEYKSAPEQYLRREPSEAARRQVSEYLDDLYDHWLEAMAQGRGLTVERMTAIVDDASFDAEAALQLGLVDAIADPVALAADLDLGDRLYDPREYLTDARLTGGPRIALIYTSGTIVPGESASGAWGGTMAGSDTVVERLRRAREDDSVVAVVLRIDSPGGSATSSDLIYREVLRVREVKPIVASMANAAASGGYYVAMAADHIVADPMTLTGSIGVYAGELDLAGTYEKLGVSFEVLQRGENAGLLSDLGPYSASQRARLQGQLEAFYGRFVARVVEGRGLTPDAVESVAQGRVWSGERAREAGLVDAVGGFWDAVAMALEIAGVHPGRIPELVTYQPEPSFLDNLIAAVFDEQLASVSTAPPWSELIDLTPLAAWSVTLDGSAQFHLPWRLQIQ